MREMIMMEKEEFEDFKSELQDAKAKIAALQSFCKELDIRSAKLWDALNRPAIEDAASKHEREYLAWCEEVAERYEEYDSWQYNNGIANRFGNDIEFAQLMRKYSSWLIDPNKELTCWDLPNETEGWTELFNDHLWWLNYHGWEQAWHMYLYLSSNAEIEYLLSETAEKSSKLYRIYDEYEHLFIEAETMK